MEPLSPGAAVTELESGEPRVGAERSPHTPAEPRRAPRVSPGAAAETQCGQKEVNESTPKKQAQEA